MKIRKVIKRDNLPVKFPAPFTLSLIVALDHWRAPGWVWGMCITLLSIIWVTAFVNAVFYEKGVDVLKNGDE